MMSSGSRAIASTIQKKLDANISFQRRKCSLEERVAFCGSEGCNLCRTAMKKGLAYQINFPSNTQSSGISDFKVFDAKSELHFAQRISVFRVNSAGRQVQGPSKFTSNNYNNLKTDQRTFYVGVVLPQCGKKKKFNLNLPLADNIASSFTIQTC